MAIVSVNRVGTLTGDERTRKITEQYQVVLDAPTIDINVIADHPDLPKQGDPHPQVNWLFVFNRRYQVELESRLRWVVEVDYEQAIVDDDLFDKFLEGSQVNPFTQPELRPPRKAWRTAEVLRPERFNRCTTKFGELRNSSGTIFETYFPGTLIKNTAGVPPVEPPQRRAFNRIFTLTRYEANYDESNSDNYLGRANATVFKGKPEYTVLCTLMDAENVYVKSATGDRRELALVTYQFEYDPNGQWEDIPNVSMVELVAGERKTILDSDGSPMSHAVFLDVDGAPIDDADGTTAELYTRHFFYEEADFNTLGL